jgi:hypothetical protein
MALQRQILAVNERQPLNIDPVIPGGGIGASSIPTQVGSTISTESKWLLGIAGTWIILTLMVDLGDTADLAVALALVIMGSVVLTYGGDVFTSLGISTVPPSSSPSKQGA